MSSEALPRRPSANPAVAAGTLAAAALATWIVTVYRMRGMDAGPGTDLGGLGWFLGVWLTMMAAMMLPSVAPMALLFARISAERRRRGRGVVPLWVFLTGYLVSWTLYGLVAYGVFRLVQGAHISALGWHAQGPLIAGTAIAAAGIYQLTPLKRVCLKHCRSPLHYVLGGWRSGWTGALRMGMEHGGFCVGCCWGLMVILFALGVMSVVWMLVVATAVFVEKALPHGQRATPLLAAAFVALGIWVAAAPSSVPGLTQPPAHAMSGMAPGPHARMNPMR